MNKALILIDFQNEWIDKDSDYYVGNIDDVLERNNKFIPEIKKQPQDILITKNKISPYYKTAMEDELRGIEEIIVTGILTNLCVRSMIQDAYDRDLDITVIKNCCVAMDDEIQNFTFKDLKETREKINFVNLDEFISNLYEQAITKN